MKDKISIITTYYNTGYIPLSVCLHSVLRQIPSSKFDIEYIIVNDGSVEALEKFVDDYLNEFRMNQPSCPIDVVHLVSDINVGRGLARRIGIEHATGNYLMFIDSDDHFLHNDLLIRAYTAIGDADICEFGFKFIDNTGKRKNYTSPNSFVIRDDKHANMKAMFYDSYIKFMPWTKLIKKSVVDKFIYSDDKEYDDILTTPYWIYAADKIVVMPWVEITYHPSNMSKNQYDTKYKTVEAISKLFEYFKNDKEILKMMYDRCMVDLRSLLEVDSDSEYFKKLSLLNTKMLSYIYPDTYKEITYNID